MAKAAKNYLKMHHPSLYKKMYGCGGKVKKGYQEGGGVEREFTKSPDFGLKKSRQLRAALQPKIVKEIETSAKGKASWEALNKKMDKAGATKYKEGGQVNKAQALQGMGDVVDAKLTPGEIVLNADQQSALEQELGQPIDGLMAKIGVPGFENGGKVEKKYTPIGDPSKLTWDYNKMSDAQKDSLVTSQEKHYESLGHSKTKMLKAYDNIRTNTPEMNERDRTGGYEDHYAAVRAREIEKKKRYDAMAKSGQRTRGSGETIYRKDGGKVEKKTPESKVGMYSSKQKFTRERTVAEKKKLKVLRTKSRKKKGKQ